jgi:hypothetical protein
MSRHPGGERYLIELQAQPSDDAPSHVRLRTWLKSALRAARMRAVSVRQLGKPPQPSPAARSGSGQQSGQPADSVDPGATSHD